MSHVIGSVEPGKAADLVIWDFKNFGTKPSMVVKCGMIAAAQMTDQMDQGDPNASIPTIEPIIMRPMFGAFNPETKILFVSQASIDEKVIESYKLRSRIEAVKGCRKIGKPDMKFNAIMPKMHVDPESYNVLADGKKCEAEPSTKLPLGHDYFVF
ncbi:Urease [Ascosphaera atra]|nr:Urease [Ascosphaera atra]